MIFDIASFLITYVVFGIAAAGFIRTFSGKRFDSFNRYAVLIFAFASAPALSSLCLFVLYLFFPKSSRLFYVASVVSFFLLIGFMGIKGIFAYVRDFISIGRNLSLSAFLKSGKDKILFKLLIVTAFSYIFFQACAFPITSHDGAVYEVFGRMLYKNASIANYPMREPDAHTGFYCPIKHPPGLTMLYAWFHVLKGANDDFMPRTVSAMYALFLVLFLMCMLFERAGGYHAYFGALTLLVTPAFVWQSFENSIDPPRMFFFMATVYFLISSSKNKSITSVILATISGFLSIYFHLSGILIVTTCALAFLFLTASDIYSYYKKGIVDPLRKDKLVKYSTFIVLFAIILSLSGVFLIKKSPALANLMKALFSLSVTYDKSDFDFKSIVVAPDESTNENLLKALDFSINKTATTNRVLLIGKLPDNAGYNPEKIVSFFSIEFPLRELLGIKKYRHIFAFLQNNRYETVLIDPRYDGREDYINSNIKDIVEQNKYFAMLYDEGGYLVYHMKDAIADGISDHVAPADLQNLKLGHLERMLNAFTIAEKNTLESNRILLVGKISTGFPAKTDNIVSFFSSNFPLDEFIKIRKHKSVFVFLAKGRYETIIIDAQYDGREQFRDSELGNIADQNKYFDLIYEDESAFKVYHMIAKESYDDIKSFDKLTVKKDLVMGTGQDPVLSPALIPGNDPAGINSEGGNKFPPSDAASIADSSLNRTPHAHKTENNGKSWFRKNVVEDIFSQKTLFGRLQIFTQPQLFGVSFFLFVLALIYWTRCSDRKKGDWLILLVIVFFVIPVMYKYYLNRRYILTVLPFVAYFSGLLLGDLYMILKRKKIEYFCLLAAIFLPVGVIVSFMIPGSQVHARFLEKGDIFKYFISGKLSQSDFLYPGLVNASLFLNDATEKDAVVLTSNDAQFYAFCKRKGIYWIDITKYPETREMKPLRRNIENKYPFLDSSSKETVLLGKTDKILFSTIYKMQIDYVLIDPIGGEKRNKELYSIYASLLSNSKIAKLIYDKGTKIWQINKNLTPVYLK